MSALALPSHMEAVLLTGHGGVERLEWRADVRIPHPALGEVLVKVAACGVNNTDINTRVGWYGASVSTGMTLDVAIHGLQGVHGDLGTWDRRSMSFPRIQGAAPVGSIVAVGHDVSAARIGERVVVDPVVRDMRLPEGARGVQYIGSERDGGYAQYVAVPAENALPVHGPVEAMQLAALPCAYQTAEEMQIRADVTASDIVVVTGASGGVGLANVQLAKLRGATVIAICAASKAERVRSQGADRVIARDEDGLSERLQTTLGDRGATVALDVVGGTMATALWHVLARGGRYATGGAIAGPVAAVDLRDLIYKDLKVFGIANPELRAMQNLVGYVVAKRLHPVVDQVFPLRALAEAQRAFAAKDHVGKIVIDLANAPGG